MAKIKVLIIGEAGEELHDVMTAMKSCAETLRQLKSLKPEYIEVHEIPADVLINGDGSSEMQVLVDHPTNASVIAALSNFPLDTKMICRHPFLGNTQTYVKRMDVFHLSTLVKEESEEFIWPLVYSDTGGKEHGILIDIHPSY